MQNKLEASYMLPDADGFVKHTGWSADIGMQYEPANIRLDRMKIKEWDSYILVSASGEYAFSMCLSDKRSVGQASACFYDIKNNIKYECYNPKLLPSSVISLSHTSESGSVVVKDLFCEFMYLVNPGDRHLYCKYSHVYNAEIELNVHLSFDNDAQSIGVVTVFDGNASQFCYNRKFPCVPVNGYVKVNGEEYYFYSDSDFAVFDWGRGVWSEETNRCWCSGGTVVDGKKFGFNIGYGFGDTSEVSENALFYDSICQKIDKIYIDIPENDGTDDWSVRSNDKRFEAIITPIYQAENNHSLVIFNQSEKMMFGKMNGKAVLDDGTVIDIKDMICFCERSQNKY